MCAGRWEASQLLLRIGEDASAELCHCLGRQPEPIGTLVSLMVGRAP